MKHSFTSINDAMINIDFDAPCRFIRLNDTKAICCESNFGCKSRFSLKAIDSGGHVLVLHETVIDKGFTHQKDGPVLKALLAPTLPRVQLVKGIMLVLYKWIYASNTVNFGAINDYLIAYDRLAVLRGISGIPIDSSSVSTSVIDKLAYLINKKADDTLFQARFILAMQIAERPLHMIPDSQLLSFGAEVAKLFQTGSSFVPRASYPVKLLNKETDSLELMVDYISTKSSKYCEGFDSVRHPFTYRLKKRSGGSRLKLNGRGQEEWKEIVCSEDIRNCPFRVVTRTNPRSGRWEIDYQETRHDLYTVNHIHAEIFEQVFKEGPKLIEGLNKMSSSQLLTISIFFDL